MPHVLPTPRLSKTSAHEQTRLENSLRSSVLKFVWYLVYSNLDHFSLVYSPEISPYTNFKTICPPKGLPVVIFVWRSSCIWAAHLRRHETPT